MSNTQKVAIISGCSSGIGLATAIGLAKNGFFVYATMRDLSKKADLEKIVSPGHKHRIPNEMTCTNPNVFMGVFPATANLKRP